LLLPAPQDLLSSLFAQIRPLGVSILPFAAKLLNSWHAQLSINLAIPASLSIVDAHHMYPIPIYPYCSSDYPTVLCLFYHHMWIGGFLIG